MFLLWSGFLLVVLVLLALDLGVFNRRPHVISIGEAFGWTAFWVALALLFNAGVYYIFEHHWFGIGQQIGHELGGKQAALQFFTGYLIEKSLSLDNIFVIAMIFAYFGIPLKYQHRLLFWGVLGAIVMRGVMIFAGVALIEKFQWMVYLFGGLLIVTAIKMLVTRHDTVQPDKNVLVKLMRKLCPMTPQMNDHHFFTRIDGKLMATPLCTALVVVESADLLFAIDSVPAVIAVTRDPFLVFTSNVFAILGLRSLYFALAAVMDRFRYLKMSLVFLLAFVGVKMILSHHYPIPTFVSLAIIAGILSVGIIGSVIAGKMDSAALRSPLSEEMDEITRATIRRVKKGFILLAGTTVIVAGAAMLILPGPGIVVILIGLGLLATEFVWAKVLLKRLRCEAGKAFRSTKSAIGFKDENIENCLEKAQDHETK